jgi:hypothetical protein
VCHGRAGGGVRAGRRWRADKGAACGQRRGQGRARARTAYILASISTWASAGISSSGIATRSSTRMPEEVMALYFMSDIETSLSICVQRGSGD